MEGGAFTHQSSISHGRGRGINNSRGIGRSLQEEDATEVLQMLLVEERIRIQVSQVVRSLIHQKSNVIIVRNLVIMHMNAGRNNMTKEGKPKSIDEHQSSVERNVSGICISN